VLIIPLWERITKGNFRRNCVKKKTQRRLGMPSTATNRGAEDDAAFAKPQQEKYYTERRQGQKAKRRPVKLKIGN